MNADKVHIFIQARSGSTRFPNKIAERIGKKAVLEHIFMAASSLRPMNTIMLVPWGEGQIASGYGCVYEGPEDDVLTRFMIAANFFNPQYILRLTSDCPLLPSSMIREFIESAPDPLTYHINRSDLLPQQANSVADGFDMELFSRGFLDYCNLVITEPEDRQHVCACYRKYADKKYSVDTPADLERVRKIYETRVLNIAPTPSGKLHLATDADEQ